MALCRGCGKKIIWGVTEDGTKIPLDPGPPVYAVAEGQAICEQGVFVHRTLGAAVSHFAICPKAHEFSGSKR